MRKYCFLIICLFATQLMKGQQYPWCQDSTAIVLDVRAKDLIYFNRISKDPRLTAIIHRFSEGTFIDTTYHPRKKIAKSKGILWGGYHMFTNRTAMEYQVDRILQFMKPADDDLVSLNFEDPGSPPNERPWFKIPMDSVFKALEYYYKKTKRYPMVYFGRSYIKDRIVPFIQKQSEARKKELIQFLSNCPLWSPAMDKDKIRSPNETLAILPFKIWNSYDLWQFSETHFCAKPQQGPVKNCDCNVTSPYTYPCCLYPSNGIWTEGTDVNVYNGTVGELRKKWPSLK